MSWYSPQSCGAHLGDVEQVERRVVVHVAQRHVLDQGDDVVDVLLVDLADLHLGDERVRRRDRVVVDLQPLADVDVVVHAHDVEEDVDVVDERRLVRAALAGRRRLRLGLHALERLVLDVLQLPGVGGLGDVAVLRVVERLEDVVDLLLLVGAADEVDVGVLAVHEVEVGAVAADGEAAGEAQLHALGARRVDGVHGLGHEAVGAAHGLRLRLRRLGLDHRARLGRARPAAQVLQRVQHGVEHVPREVDARPALLRPLREQAARLELADRAARRGVGDLEDAAWPRAPSSPACGRARRPGAGRGP